ncbi:hypothetical protein T265_09482 [Opisthorchis viverrini]|uniref:Caspase domain protein n=1 Tax=Opisthorchis viverrini TaxID=6198 RepID=A0A074Z5M6_OPIVI|nr:hypothetical protein T265_09482 [Opisthorchis viverrini]KER22436.1 hypothetical protein T265_09482 [Opisthorchis viverrini]
MRKNKVPPENIITFAHDDIANNPKNPFKGKVFHDYELEDVYKGVLIDYRGKDVTKDNFLKVLEADNKLEANKKKVLKSGPDDNVFIFYSGHGGKSFVTFPEADLTAMELDDTLAYMHSDKMYNKLVLYVDACYSGSMFKDVLPSNMGIYATTSANEEEQSWSLFCYDKRFGVCLANEYSYAWITDSEYNDLKKRTVEQQYQEVKKRTALSHAMKYGEMPIAVDRKPSFSAHLFPKFRRFMGAETDGEHETAWRKLHRAIQLRHIVKETFRDIVIDVTTQHMPTIKGLSKRDELVCFKAVFDQFRTHCFTIQQVPDVAHHISHLMELCKAGYGTETLIDSVYLVCS